MAWRFTGNVVVDVTAPEAAGRCERCGFWFNLDQLQFQYEWQGAQLMSTGHRVCPTCLDVPYQFDRPLILPPDPVPVWQPREEDFAYADGNDRVTQDGDQRVTEDGGDRVTQMTGDDMLRDLYG